MSRAAFARSANVSVSSIVRLEHGKEVRASTYLAIIAYLQRRYPVDGVVERIALLPDTAREQVLALIRSFESQS